MENSQEWDIVRTIATSNKIPAHRLTWTSRLISKIKGIKTTIDVEAIMRPNRPPFWANHHVQSRAIRLPSMMDLLVRSRKPFSPPVERLLEMDAMLKYLCVSNEIEKRIRSLGTDIVDAKSNGVRSGRPALLARFETGSYRTRVGVAATPLCERRGDDQTEWKAIERVPLLTNFSLMNLPIYIAVSLSTGGWWLSSRCTWRWVHT